jgi:hypothetical protein
MKGGHGWTISKPIAIRNRLLSTMGSADAHPVGHSNRPKIEESMQATQISQTGSVPQTYLRPANATLRFDVWHCSKLRKIDRPPFKKADRVAHFNESALRRFYHELF